MTIAEHPASALLDSEDHEQVVVRQDPATGLRLIVAVHSTVLGPSLGGMRLRRYPGLRDALEDVLALSRTMTLKASAAGLDLGGGKAVMIDDGRDDLREARLEDGGARVIACDIDEARADRLAVELGVELAPSAEAIMGMELDVLSPCAAGGLIDDALARSIECNVVAGAANNPLTGRPAAAA